jgi:hypothetical protein
MPGLANAVLAVGADFAVEQPESKYKVTVDAFDTVPRMVGVKLEPGFPLPTDANVRVGVVTS